MAPAERETRVPETIAMPAPTIWPLVTALGITLGAAGLVTHLHRDHADAGALTKALVAGAPVLEPKRAEDLALAQADAELALTLTRESAARAEATTLLTTVSALRQQHSP